ncbi:MAG: response regulator [Candidatus Aceula meridiana]|nr:response regulator [Candidatus Aceula meridiana]
MEKKKILLAEDETSLREIVAAALEKHGFEVCQASSGEGAFVMAHDEMPDIVVSDVVMPGQSGNDLLKLLRSSAFGKNIPFIVVTAHANMKDYFEMVEVDGFIEKPFKMAELIAKIEKVLAPCNSDEAKKEAKPGAPLRPKIKISSQAEGVLNSDMVHASGGGATVPSIEAEKIKRTWKILLGEDDPRIHNKLQQIFFKINCFTRITLTPSKCLEEAVGYLPDLILIKNVFCGMPANQLIDLLQGMSRLRGIPIAVYGGNELRKIKNSIVGKDISVLLYDGETQLFQRAEGFVKGMFKET